MEAILGSSGWRRNRRPAAMSDLNQQPCLTAHIWMDARSCPSIHAPNCPLSDTAKVAADIPIVGQIRHTAASGRISQQQ